MVFFFQLNYFIFPSPGDFHQPLLNNAAQTSQMYPDFVYFFSVFPLQLLLIHSGSAINTGIDKLKEKL